MGSFKPPDSEDVTNFSAAAEQGDPEALYRIGRCLYYGIGILKDEARAVSCWTRASEARHADARCSLALHYLTENGTGRDEDKGNALLLSAAEMGSGKAQIQLAAQRFKAKQPGGIEWARKAAEQGVPRARTLLFLYYERGHEVEKDEQTALRWLKAAVEHGEADAQVQMGLLCMGGRRVPKDLTRAVSLFEAAGREGIAQGHYYLGYLYARGEGVRKDLKKAFQHYLEAAQLGMGLALYRVGKCYRAGHGTDKDLRKANEAFRDAEAKGIKGCRYQIFMTGPMSVRRTILIVGAFVVLFVLGMLYEDLPLRRFTDLFIMFPLVILIPAIFESDSELRANEMEMHFSIVDLWAGLPGFLPSIWLAANLGPWMFSGNTNGFPPWLAMFVVGYVFVAQAMAFYWGVLATRISSLAETNPWRARFDTFLRQLFFGVITNFLFLLLMRW